jgi:energy-coupling factor transport system permease protein
MMHPLVKFGLLCVYAGAVLAAPGLAAKAGLVGLVLIAGRRWLLSRKLFRVALSFGAFIVLVQALLTPGAMLAKLGPLTITSEGLRVGAAMALRFLGILGGSVLFVATTSPEEFSQALSTTRIPYRYTYVLVLVLRFLPLFREEYKRVREAQALRGLRLRPWSLLSHVRWTAVPVLASALSRADGVALAMQGRAFGRYPRRTPATAISWTSADWGAVLAMVCGLVGVGWFLSGGGAGWP